MLKIIMWLQVLVANKIFTTNEINSIECDDESIEKYKKLLKTGNLSKSQKSAKSRNKLSKSGN